jgi:hypothetical protein
MELYKSITFNFIIALAGFDQITIKGTVTVQNPAIKIRNI